MNETFKCQIRSVCYGQKLTSFWWQIYNFITYFGKIVNQVENMSFEMSFSSWKHMLTMFALFTAHQKSFIEERIWYWSRNVGKSWCCWYKPSLISFQCKQYLHNLDTVLKNAQKQRLTLDNLYTLTWKN